MQQRVLFVCTHNSARSQMAEGMLRAWGGDRFEVFSAGTQPTEIRPEATAVMAEIGIDISGHRAKPLSEFAGEEFGYKDPTEEALGDESFAWTKANTSDANKAYLRSLHPQIRFEQDGPARGPRATRRSQPDHGPALSTSGASPVRYEHPRRLHLRANAGLNGSGHAPWEEDDEQRRPHR